MFWIAASKIKREKKIQEISTSSINLSVENPNKQKSSQERFDCDPGVISDDDDFAVIITNFRFICNSMNISKPPVKFMRINFIPNT